MVALCAPSLFLRHHYLVELQRGRGGSRLDIIGGMVSLLAPLWMPGLRQVQSCQGCSGGHAARGSLVRLRLEWFRLSLVAFSGAEVTAGVIQKAQDVILLVPPVTPRTDAIEG